MRLVFRPTNSRLSAHLTRRIPLFPTHRLPSAPRNTVAPGPSKIYREALSTKSVSNHRQHLDSRVDLFTASAAVLVLLFGFGLHSHWTAQASTVAASSIEESTFLHTSEDMPVETLPGRPGTLTPDQEEKLRQLWAHVLRLCGVIEDNSTPASTEAADSPEPEAAAGSKPEKTKKRLGLFKRNKEHADSAPKTHIKESDAGDDKYGQTQQFYDTIANSSPEQLRNTIWSMVKHDHPDALLLRFLRARKWNVDNALVMFISTMNWRLNEVHVDDDIMKNGEGGAVDDETNGQGSSRALGADFMKQVRMGKSFLHGHDKNGRPICVVRARLHRASDQSEESVERYTVFLIETARMLLTPPVDTACVVFDLTGFSMANMDYAPVKFMIKCFEANYPESLGVVLIHKAPWLFQGVWKVIKGWLDPVVAAKVNFTNSASDLKEFIDSNNIIKELEGQETWEYKYVEPVAGENDQMKDTATRDKIVQERAALSKEYESATLRWISDGNAADIQAIKQEREQLAQKLRNNYWTLDPYIRARSFVDRTGVIQSGGNIEYYPTAQPAATSHNVSTSADDVD